MKKIISVSDIFPPLFLNISFCNNKKQGNQEQRNNCGKLRFFFRVITKLYQSVPIVFISLPHFSMYFDLQSMAVEQL